MRRRRLYLPMERRVRLWFFLIFVPLAVLLIFGYMHLQTMLGDLAATRVSNTVNRIVVNAVSEAVDSGEIQYDRLIHLEKDNDGDITAIRSDMAEFNRLQALITDTILARLEQIGEVRLSIPLGTLTGSALLAGRGPRLSVKVQAIGNCTARFENNYSHAGINQTTHSIILCVDTSISILLPGFRTATKLFNNFAVAETVIVGDVPDTYTYFKSGEETEDSAYEYMLNKG